MTRVRSAWALGLALACLLAPGAEAKSRVPYGGEFLDQIHATFFEPAAAPGPDLPRARLSAERVAAYRAYIQRKLRFAVESIANHERLERGRSASKARKRAEGRDTPVALRHVLELLERMQASDDAVLQHTWAAEALMVDYATRSYAEPIGSVNIPSHLLNMVMDWSWPRQAPPRHADREASNLVDPATGLFYTPDDLAGLMREGVDLSRLDPPAHTPFWRAKADISAVPISQNYLYGGVPVLEGIEMEYPPPDGAVVQFEKVHKTQSKPKLDVTWKSERCLRKKAKRQKACAWDIKLKFGMETHADPTSNALLASLGYNADVAVHLKDVRIYLGDTPFEDIERDWTAYFDVQRVHLYIPLASVMSERGRDEQGEYIVFPGAVAELKAPEIDRIGLWPFSEGMARNAREARGLGLFNVWIANADMKDEENNKLQLRADADGELRMYLTQQDIGHSMGLGLPERVQVFPWEAIESSWWSRFFGWSRGRLELNYINLQDSGLQHGVTWADAKWMARRIAQLTREQIAEAVALGRWPGGIGPLYVEKLINRRNQFVEVFGLQDEYALLPVDRALTTPDGSVVDGDLVQGRFEGSMIDYDKHWEDLFQPVLDIVADGTIAIVQGGISTVDEINPGDFRISGRVEISPDVIFELSRRIRANPHAAGRDDLYIVQDTLKIGARPGIGYIGKLEVGGWRRISLAYPVARWVDGVHARSRILNVLLPWDVYKGDLPERYVLYRERAWLAGGRVRTSDEFDPQPGADAALDRVWMRRSVVDHREEAPIVWVDRPVYWETKGRAYIKLWLLEIPFFRASWRAGDLDGNAWVLDPERLSQPGAEGEPIFERIVRRGDLDEIERVAIAEPRRLDVDFRQRASWLGAVLATVRATRREEHILETTASGEPVRREVQIERRKRGEWAIIDNSELHEWTATGTLGASAAHAGASEEGFAEAAKPEVVLRHTVDDSNTHSDELDGYYRFLAGLGAGEQLVAPGFHAQDWEVSARPQGRWTRMITRAGVFLRSGALDALCELDEGRYWDGVARRLGMDRAEVERIRERARAFPHKVRVRAFRGLPFRQRRVLRRAPWVLRHVQRACRATTPRNRLAAHVDALAATVLRDHDTFEPALLASLLEAAGTKELIERGDLTVGGRITKAFDDENNLPERRDVIGLLGPREDAPAARYRLFPQDPLDLYEMLDWVRAEP